ncbi:uncharacterized protein [Euwallacea fornicatus]
MESSWTLEYRIFLDDCFVRSARVHEAKPRTLEEQKEAMPHQITEIDGDLPEGVEANFFERLQHCINFGHLPNDPANSQSKLESRSSGSVNEISRRSISLERTALRGAQCYDWRGNPRRMFSYMWRPLLRKSESKTDTE